MRDIVFPAQLYYDLQRHKEQQGQVKEIQGSSWQDYDLVFPSNNGAPLDESTLYHRFHRCCKLAGLDGQGFTPYTLRYSYATLLLLVGERDKVISDSMGHARVNFSKDVYQRVLPIMQEMASDKIENMLFSNSRTTLAQPVNEQVM